MAHSALAVKVMLLIGYVCTGLTSPISQLREISNALSVTLIQTQITESVITMPEESCLTIGNVHVPTEIQLAAYQTGSYKLRGFSGPSCNVTGENSTLIFETNFNSSKIVNDRHPICSFHLNQNSRESTTVTFYKDLSEGSIKHSIEISNTDCVDICSFQSQAWLRYATLVEIKERNQLSSNSIQLYTDDECSHGSKEFKVGNGVDLGMETRKQSIIGSLSVSRE